MSIVLRHCPVCDRMIHMGRYVLTHNDTAERRCIMSNRPAPTRWWGLRAVAPENTTSTRSEAAA